jgi:hypothetical protein
LPYRIQTGQNLPIQHLNLPYLRYNPFRLVSLDPNF